MLNYKLSIIEFFLSIKQILIESHMHAVNLDKMHITNSNLISINDKCIKYS